jgi:hypothetical protein
MKAHSINTDTRIALLEQSIGHINETLNRIDKRLDNLEINMENNFKEVRKDSVSQFRWLLGIIITLFGLPIIQNTIIHFWSH